MSKEQQLLWHRRAEKSYSTFKIRRGGGEKISLIQGKEQWLQFAGAAMKRYPMSKVRENSQGHEKGGDLISGKFSPQSCLIL